ncbi:MAG: hypothetical protein ACOC32_04975 [Nanoarchaeota archaeon]
MKYKFNTHVTRVFLFILIIFALMAILSWKHMRIDESFQMSNGTVVTPEDFQILFVAGVTGSIVLIMSIVAAIINGRRYFSDQEEVKYGKRRSYKD